MQPLQSHTTDVDDNTSENCGKLYYREILPTPYIYSQILFHFMIMGKTFSFLLIFYFSSPNTFWWSDSSHLIENFLLKISV